MKREIVLGLVLACGLAVQTGPAIAALGGDLSSVQADRVALGATLRTTSAAAYTMHEMTLPSGVVVHEFAGADNAVFAVTWHGPFVPDFRQLLANYFPRFQELASQRKPGMRRIDVASTDLVVQSAGHQRAMVGRVYIPAKVPAGMSIDEIR
jgi:hypothetical protein